MKVGPGSSRLAFVKTRLQLLAMSVVAQIVLANAGLAQTPSPTPTPVPPAITTQPANKTVTEGQTATFKVTATGTTPLLYQWQKNGTAIAAATKAYYTTPATTAADTGEQFAVTVSNTFGSVISNNAALTVNPPTPPSIVTQPASKTVTVGQTAKFSVKATGTTPLTFQWSKNGADIAGANTASYTTPVTTSGDTGSLFAVTISNRLGSVLSNSARLTVSNASGPPSITIQPINEVVTAGKTATFNVTAIGALPLQYQWQINGATMAPTQHSYTTAPTSEADSGITFAVTVSNGLGSVTSNTVTLTVQPSPSPTPTPIPTPTPSLPPINHVFVVMEENHSYSEIIGSGAMPYLQSLANQYGLATNYYANTHPSIGNYFMLTAGQIITNSDAYTLTVPDDNIVRHLIANGKTWREYSEGLPSVGYFGAETTAGYEQHHNPLSYFSDVRESTTQQQNLVPFTQLASDMAAGQLPNYGFIVPTDNHNGHNGTATAADQWLQTNIDPLIHDPQFQQDGLLFIVFDEGRPTDKANGGGQIVCVVVGPTVKPGYTSDIVYQHQNLLRTVCDLLGIGSFSSPSLATDSAASMAEFITPLPSPSPSPPLAAR